MHTKKIFIVIIFILIARSLSGQQFTDLYGDYLGQTPPGDMAVIFAPGIIEMLKVMAIHEQVLINWEVFNRKK